MTSPKFGLLALASAAVLALSGCSGTTQQEPDPTPSASGSGFAQPGQPVVKYNKWEWFKDTYWIVPQDGIDSVLHSGTDPSSFTVTRGQTVFHITDYYNGYWSGAVVVKLTAAQVPACQYVLGQTTPEGKVYMTMYDAKTGAVVNDPVGEMVQVDDQWTMVNTMTGPTNQGGTLSHWAYMVQSREGDSTFANLPFAEQSIPDFMSACPPGPPIKGRP